MRFTLVKKIDESRGTKSFFFKPEKPVSYLPGQYYYFTLPKLDFPDPRGNTRHFTISTSPTEKGLFRFTTRIREESGFKKTLDNLPMGIIIDGEGPTGTYILDEAEKDNVHIFIAGGIGITPFRSFIKYNIDKNLKIPTYLIYSNSDSDFVFGKEPRSWQKENNFFKVEFFDSSKFGHLNYLKINELIGNWSLVIGNLIWWVVGPPAFVDAMEDNLSKLKISSSQILTEKFTGY